MRMAKKGGIGVLLLVLVVIAVLIFAVLVFFKKIPIQIKEHEEIPKLNISLELQKADTLLRNAKYKDAAELYRKILEAEPDNYLANIGLAESYAWMERYEDSMKILNKALNSGRYDYKLFFGFGNYYMAKGDYEKSYYYLNKSYGMNPNDKTTIQYLMGVTNKIGDYDLTIQLANISSEKFGESANAYRSIATAYFFKNDFQRALVVAKKADKIVANYSGNRLLLGTIYLALNETNIALEEFQKVTEIRDSNSALEGISMIYKMRNDEQNYNRYKALADSSGKGEFPLSGLGYALLNINQYDLAAEIFNLAISANPSYYLPYKGMGEFLLKTGQKDKAVPYLKKASELGIFDTQSEKLLAEAKK